MCMHTGLRAFVSNSLYYERERFLRLDGFTIQLLPDIWFISTIYSLCSLYLFHTLVCLSKAIYKIHQAHNTLCPYSMTSHTHPISQAFFSASPSHHLPHQPLSQPRENQQHHHGKPTFQIIHVVLMGLPSPPPFPAIAASWNANSPHSPPTKNTESIYTYNPAIASPTSAQ